MNLGRGEVLGAWEKWREGKLARMYGMRQSIFNRKEGKEI